MFLTSSPRAKGLVDQRHQVFVLRWKGVKECCLGDKKRGAIVPSNAEHYDGQVLQKFDQMMSKLSDVVRNWKNLDLQWLSCHFQSIILRDTPSKCSPRAEGCVVQQHRVFVLRRKGVEESCLGDEKRGAVVPSNADHCDG